MVRKLLVILSMEISASKNGLAQSCNVVFAELAVELGKDTMTKYADQLR